MASQKALIEQLEAYQEAQAAFEQVDLKTRDWRGYAELLIELGDVLIELDRMDECLEVLEVAQLAAKHCEDRKLEARVLRERGWTFSEVERPEKALDCLLEALAVLDREPEAYALRGSIWHERAFAHHLLGDSAAAAKGYEAAIAAWFKVPINERDWSELVLEHRCLADKLGEQGEFEDALNVLYKARALFDESPKATREQQDLVEVLTLTSTILDRLGRHEEALKVCRSSLDLLEAVPPKVRQASSLAEVSLQIGILLHELGQSEEALDYCIRALEVCEADRSHVRPTIDARQISQCHWWLGHIFEESDRFEEALEAYEAAADIERKMASVEDGELEESEALQGTLSRIAAVLEQLERPDEALEVLEEERALAELRSVESESLIEVASVLQRIGELHKSLGNEEEGLACFQEALSRYRALPGEKQDRELVSWSMMQVGFSLAEMGARAQALTTYRETRGFVQDAPPSHRAEVLSMIGHELWSLGRLQEALEVHQEARAVMELVPKEGRDWNEYGKVLRLLGGALFELGLIERSLEAYQESIRAHHSAGDPLKDWELIAIAHHNLGIALLYLERYDHALSELRLARSAHGCIPEAQRDWEEYANTVAHIASCLRTMGRDDEAEAAMDEAQIAQLRAQPELFVN